MILLSNIFYEDFSFKYKNEIFFTRKRFLNKKSFFFLDCKHTHYYPINFHERLYINQAAETSGINFAGDITKLFCR